MVGRGYSPEDCSRAEQLVSDPKDERATLPSSKSKKVRHEVFSFSSQGITHMTRLETLNYSSFFRLKEQNNPVVLGVRTN